MNIKFKLPRNIISNTIVKNVLYLITLALALSYIINEQSLALISLILIACIIYITNKNVVISLIISIIVTNLLLSMNYLQNSSILETLQIASSSCCRGQAFYTDYLLTYKDISLNIATKSTCEQMERDISGKIPSEQSQKATFFAKLYSNNDYLKAKSICKTMDQSSNIYYVDGTLFKKINRSYNILDDQNILPKDILDLIATSNITSSLTTNNKIILERDIIAPLESINDTLIYNSRQNNLQRQISISDLTSDQITRLASIKTMLKGLFNLSNRNLITKTDISYTLINKNSYLPVLKNGVQYLLKPDQFFDCSGTVQTGNVGEFLSSAIQELSNNDFFGTSGIPVSRGGLGDASYNPYGTLTQADLYPSNKDLEMELRRLETLPASGNVPVNIISTYLNAINSFYEKQIQNLTTTRSSTFSQTPINDIYSIRTMKPTFFTYDHSTNNDYQCENSITGNSAFKYCGPSSYYEIPKF